MDDDIMQARRPMGRRPVAEAEFAVAPSTTAFSSKPSTDRELFPAWQCPKNTGDGMQGETINIDANCVCIGYESSLLLLTLTFFSQ
jgi:hypothetical protein